MPPGACTRFLSSWWHARTVAARLRSDSEAVRETAIAELVAGSPSTLPLLVRLLRGSSATACGAADALSRLGHDVGVQSVLTRSYYEEWLTATPDRQSTLRSLRRLERSAISAALIAGLMSAPVERSLQGCIDRLALSLSAFRLLLAYGERSPLTLWETGLWFGHNALPRVRTHPFADLAYGLCDHIRQTALRGLIVQYQQDVFDVLTRAIDSRDLSVTRTAIAGLARLRDSRALALLQRIAFAEQHPLGPEARNAIEKIAGSEAQPLTLLRGSLPDANVTVHNDLLRTVQMTQEEERCALLRSADRADQRPE